MFFWVNVLFINERGTHSLPNKAASFSTARHYWPVDIRCISPPALTDWKLGLEPRSLRRVSVSSQTSDNQRGTPGLAGGRGLGTSPGAAYLCSLDPVSQDHRVRGREECEEGGGRKKEKGGTRKF